MYGLFNNSYDYYKWEDLVCVSENKERLKKYHKKFCSKHPLMSEKESNDVDLKKTEQQHYVILKIKKI